MRKTTVPPRQRGFKSTQDWNELFASPLPRPYVSSQQLRDQPPPPELSRPSTRDASSLSHAGHTRRSGAARPPPPSPLPGQRGVGDPAVEELKQQWCWVCCVSVPLCGSLRFHIRSSIWNDHALFYTGIHREAAAILCRLHGVRAGRCEFIIMTTTMRGLSPQPSASNPQPCVPSHSLAVSDARRLRSGSVSARGASEAMHGGWKVRQQTFQKSSISSWQELGQRERRGKGHADSDSPRPGLQE